MPRHRHQAETLLRSCKESWAARCARTWWKGSRCSTSLQGTQPCPSMTLLAHFDTTTHIHTLALGLCLVLSKTKAYETTRISCICNRFFENNWNRKAANLCFPSPSPNCDHNMFPQHFVKRLWYNRLLQHFWGASSCNSWVKNSLVEQCRTILENKIARFQRAAQRCICADSGRQIQSVANVPSTPVIETYGTSSRNSLLHYQEKKWTEIIHKRLCHPNVRAVTCVTDCNRTNQTLLDNSTKDSITVTSAYICESAGKRTSMTSWGFWQSLTA